MADSDTKLNEFERSMEGCYGQRVTYDDVYDFLDTNLVLNDEAEVAGIPRFSICMWGHAGIGKTSIVKSYAARPVTWHGTEYQGYSVHDVPIAQFEEMGDLHGLPTEHILMRNNGDTHWVARELMDFYVKEGWTVDLSQPARTMYAPPDWVPIKPGPSILLLDDWNRASIRIIRGIMQLLQNYGMVSWKLPPGCTIILTGNPSGAGQDYLTTEVDCAILSRIKHITLREDARQWAVWAEAQKLDPRGINFILQYPEMMCGKELTNPRTLSEFFRYLRRVPREVTGVEKPDPTDSMRRELLMHAYSLLDEETVTTMLTFFQTEMEYDLDPSDILEGKPGPISFIKKVLSSGEPRIDILGVALGRLYAKMAQPDCQQTPARVKNFQNFLTLECIPKDARYAFCQRLAKLRDGRAEKWLLGDAKLRTLILSLLQRKKPKK